MPHEALAPAFHSLVDLDAAPQAAATGFDFIEGPVWNPRGHFLLFSDIPGNVRFYWDSNGVRENARPSNKGNGMTYDKDLALLVCEHATSCLVRVAAGRREVLASHFDGKELNSPNDVIVGSDDSIYFTDPTYGRMPRFGIERPAELGFQGVYRIAPEGGAPQLLVDPPLFTQPNGLCFSPDEKLLYVNDTTQANIRVFEVRNGTLANMRVFAADIRSPDRRGHPDGMKCDANGNVWVTAPGGIWVYDPAGELLGKLEVPEFVANFSWGGPDWRTLFIAASTTLFTLPVNVGPRLEPFMRFH
jgi:gluconolactonase